VACTTCGWSAARNNPTKCEEKLKRHKVYYLLGFAFDSPIPNAPRQVREAELRALFTPEHGWRVLALRPARLLIRSAWLGFQEAGHKAATLAQAMANNANALAGLAQGLAALAARGNDVPGIAACVERVPLG